MFLGSELCSSSGKKYNFFFPPRGVTCLSPCLHQKKHRPQISHYPDSGDRVSNECTSREAYVVHNSSHALARVEVVRLSVFVSSISAISCTLGIFVCRVLSTAGFFFFLRWLSPISSPTDNVEVAPRTISSADIVVIL